MFKPTPMDFRILELLPPVGLIGGVHWRGRFANDISKEILEEIPDEDKQYVHINGLTVGSNLSLMLKENLVKSYPGKAKGNRLWARTPSGTELLQKKNEILNGYKA